MISRSSKIYMTASITIWVVLICPNDGIGQVDIGRGNQGVQLVIIFLTTV